MATLPNVNVDDIIDSSLHSESSSSNDDIHIQHAGGNSAFDNWLKKNCPYIFSHYTLPSDSELNKLKEKYTSEAIAETCSAIENRIDLRKRYSNLYRTLLNWLKRRDEGGSEQRKMDAASMVVRRLAQDDAAQKRASDAATLIAELAAEE